MNLWEDHNVYAIYCEDQFLKDGIELGVERAERKELEERLQKAGKAYWLWGLAGVSLGVIAGILITGAGS